MWLTSQFTETKLYGIMYSTRALLLWCHVLTPHVFSLHWVDNWACVYLCTPSMPCFSFYLPLDCCSLWYEGVNFLCWAACEAFVLLKYWTIVAPLMFNCTIILKNSYTGMAAISFTNLHSWLKQLQVFT